jgi:hypothetical protein
MNFENLCQICQEKSASYKCPKCQIRYCSLTCYRDALHNRCSKEFDENEIFDSMNIDEDNHQNPTTTTNNFVRERIEDILKRKIEEKDFHNEEDDEQMEEFFEHLLPSKDSETYRQVRLTHTSFPKFDYFYRKLLMSMMRMMKVKVKNVLLVMKNLCLIYLMILMNPMRMSINYGLI